MQPAVVATRAFAYPGMNRHGVVVSNELLRNTHAIVFGAMNGTQQARSIRVPSMARAIGSCPLVATALCRFNRTRPVRAALREGWAR
jgi:hypothetical protein